MQEDADINVHCDIIYNGLKLETKHPPARDWLNKRVYPLNKYLCSHWNNVNQYLLIGKYTFILLKEK